MTELSTAIPAASERRNVPAEILGTRAAIFHLLRPTPQLPKVSGQAEAHFLRVTKVSLDFPAGVAVSAASVPKQRPYDAMFSEDTFWFKDTRNSTTY